MPEGRTSLFSSYVGCAYQAVLVAVIVPVPQPLVLLDDLQQQKLELQLCEFTCSFPQSAIQVVAPYSPPLPSRAHVRVDQGSKSASYPP